MSAGSKLVMIRIEIGDHIQTFLCEPKEISIVKVKDIETKHIRLSVDEIMKSIYHIRLSDIPVFDL